MARTRHVGCALGYGTAGDLSAAGFIAIVGARYAVSHFFYGNSIPTSLASASKNLAAEQTAGRRACLDFELTHYGVNGAYGSGGTPAAGAVTDKNNLVSFLTDCQANGLDFTVCLWHEPYDKFDVQATQALNNLDYSNSMGYYGAALRALGIPVMFDPSNYSCNHHWAQTIGNATSPGLGWAACSAGRIDEVYSDFYLNEGNSGSTPAGSGIQGSLNNIEALADAFSLPLGLLEMGYAPATNAVNWNEADISAFRTVVTNKFAARAAAGKPIADLIAWGTNDNATQAGMYLPSGWSSGSKTHYQGLFDTYDGGTYGVGGAPGLTLANDLESGTNGVGIDTVNSSGVAGLEDPFDEVTASGTGVTATYDSTHVHDGTLAFKSHVGSVIGSSHVGWSTSLGTNMPQIWDRAYVYILTALPSANVRVIRYQSGGSFAGAIDITTTGHLALYNSAGTLLTTGTATVPLNSYFRIEGFAIGSATAGKLESKLFLSPDSDVADETLTSASNINTLGLLSGTTIGNPSSATNWDVWFDGLAASTEGYVGPLGTDIPGAAALSGTGSLTAAGKLGLAGTAALSGAGVLAASVQVPGVSLPGAAALSGTGSLAAAARVNLRALAALSGIGVLTPRVAGPGIFLSIPPTAGTAVPVHLSGTVVFTRTAGTADAVRSSGTAVVTTMAGTAVPSHMSGTAV